MPPPHKAVSIEKPETPQHLRTKLDEVWEKMNEGELLYARLDEKAGAMAKTQDQIQKDLSELRSASTRPRTLTARWPSAGI